MGTPRLGCSSPVLPCRGTDMLDWEPLEKSPHQSTRMAIRPSHDRDGFHYTITAGGHKTIHFFDRNESPRNPSLKLPPGHQQQEPASSRLRHVHRTVLGPRISHLPHGVPS